MMLSGCGMIDDSGKDCPDMPASTSDEIMLSFKMMTENVGTTRTDDFSGHEETDSEWPAFEDNIDLRDFAFYIFLESAEDKPLVMKVTDIASSTDPNQMVTGALGAYTVTTKIPKKNLEDLLGYELTANSSEKVDFRLVLLANEGIGKDGYAALAPYDAVHATEGHEATTFADFMKNAEALTFNINSIYNPVESDATVDGIYKGTIPMYGMKTYTTTEDLLFKSRPEERIYMGEVYMLRSLAKIKVIDYSEKNADGYPYISAVVIEGRTNTVSPLPADAAGYVNGAQVHIPRIMEATAGANTAYRLGTLTRTAATPPRGTVRIGYIPEQQVVYGMPTIAVTARLDADRTETYSIPMGGGGEYPAFGFGDYIIRNHIYTLNVNSIAVGAPADITVEAAPWTESDYTLDYSENVSVSNRLEWVPSSYASREGETIVVRPWTTGADGKTEPVALEGTFAIRTPEGATWTAYLIDNGGSDTGAFAFLVDDAEGNASLQSSVSGTISKDNTGLSRLAIVTTREAPSGEEPNRAILQVVVTIGQGASASMVEVPLTPINSTALNFTIVQNPQ